MWHLLDFLLVSIARDWKFEREEQYQFGNGSKKSTYQVNMIDFNLISLS